MKKHIFIIIASCLANFSFSQLQETQINMTIDTVVNSWNAYPIDMNNDGITDFELLLLNTTSSGGLHNVNLGSSNASNEIVRPSYNDVTVFNDAEIVGPTTSGWYSSAGDFATIGGYLNARLAYKFFPNNPSGNFANVSNKYIGVRFMIGTDLHYGYVEVSSDVSTFPASFTIHSVGYNLTPNTAVQIGSFAGISDQSNESLKVYPNPAKDFIRIETDGYISSVEFMTLTGTSVSVIQHPTSDVSVSHLSHGIYLVKVIDEENRIYLSKVIKTD